MFSLTLRVLYCQSSTGGRRSTWTTRSWLKSYLQFHTDTITSPSISHCHITPPSLLYVCVTYLFS